MKLSLMKIKVDKRIVPIVVILVAAAAAPLLMTRYGVPPYWLHVSIVAFYYAILASSWSLLAGYAGQFSFGHLAFMAIGAYTSGLLGKYLSVGVLPGIISGTLLAGVFGLIVGFLCLRLRSTYLALFTIAFSEIVRLVLMAERAITEGPDGLPMTPLVATTSKVPAYYVHLGLLVVVLAFMYWLASSRFGLFFRALREDEEAAAAMGVHIVRYKVMVFVITSMIAGMAGAVQFHYVEIITPNSMLVLQMSIVITMAVIGGLENLFAAALGAIIIHFSLELMRPLLNWRLVVFGLLLMFTLRFFQNGLLHPILNYLFRRGALAETVAKRVQAAEVASPLKLGRSEVASPPKLRGGEVTSPPELRGGEVTSPPKLRGGEVTSPPKLRGGEVTSPPELGGTEGGQNHD